MKRDLALVLSMVALATLARADGDRLREGARRISDAAYDLRDLTEDLIAGRGDHGLVATQIDTMEALLRDFRAELDGGGAGGFAECAAKLVNASFNHGYAADQCRAAGVNAGRFATCAVEMVGASFNHGYAADACKAAGPLALEFGQCSVDLVGVQFNHGYAADKCKAAGNRARGFASCAVTLVGQGYNHGYAADQCLANP